jgi:hypothetical protein
MECEIVTVFAFAIYHEVSRVNLILGPIPSTPTYPVE